MYAASRSLFKQAIDSLNGTFIYVQKEEEGKDRDKFLWFFKEIVEDFLKTQERRGSLIYMSEDVSSA